MKNRKVCKRIAGAFVIICAVFALGYLGFCGYALCVAGMVASALYNSFCNEELAAKEAKLAKERSA